ncbi:hypothetical protein ALC62_13709, partial [Cyphomyrmex costatus]
QDVKRSLVRAYITQESSDSIGTNDKNKEVYKPRQWAILSQPRTIPHPRYGPSGRVRSRDRVCGTYQLIFPFAHGRHRSANHALDHGHENACN